jgi:hypothetical protein
VTLDGSGFWLSGVDNDDSDGNGGGIWYVPFGETTASQLVSLPNDAINSSTDTYTRWLRIFNGQLFSGSDESPPYMFTIGSVGGPIPASGIQPIATLPGVFANPPTTPSPYGFMLFDLVAPPGPDTLYIADDGLNPAGIGDTGNLKSSGETGGGGLSKYSLNGSTGQWSLVWTIPGALWPADAGAQFANQPMGFRGLAGFATGTMVTLMTTTANIEGLTDSLAVVVVVDDAGSMAPPSPTIVASTPMNKVFRGVTLTPQ